MKHPAVNGTGLRARFLPIQAWRLALAEPRRAVHSVRVTEPPRDRFQEAGGAPYWRSHYGIGQPWAPTARGRRGCILMLMIALATFALVGVVAVIVYVLR